MTACFVPYFLYVQTNRVKTLRREVSIATKVIETLSHTCCSTEQLQTMLEKLHEVIKIVKARLPTSEGLTLRPLSLLERARRIKRKYMKLSKKASVYASLESHSRCRPGRKRADFRHRNRFGRKADRIRKVYI